MLTCEEPALVTEIQDRLIELYVQQDEARREHGPDRAHELQVEIDKAHSAAGGDPPLKSLRST